MAIYVDQLRNWGWRLGPSCHLFTDGPNEELHAFAARLGLKRAWFQKSTSGPHYDPRRFWKKRKAILPLPLLPLTPRPLA